MEWLDRVHIYFVGGGSPLAPNNWVYHYQSLIAGALALVAAILTAYFIRKQIEVSEQQHTELIARQYRSVRANLPLALSEIIDYSHECLDILQNLMTGHEEEDDIKAEIILPNLPTSAVRLITELIALAKEGDAKKLQAVLRFIQIQHSRFRSLARDLSPIKAPGTIVIMQNLRSDVLDACVLHKMANYIFPFARWETESLPEFDQSGLTGWLDYLIGTKFDHRTHEYVRDRLVKSTSYYLSKTGSQE